MVNRDESDKSSPRNCYCRCCVMIGEWRTFFYFLCKYYLVTTTTTSVSFLSLFSSYLKRGSQMFLYSIHFIFVLTQTSLSFSQSLKSILSNDTLWICRVRPLCVFDICSLTYHAPFSEKQHSSARVCRIPFSELWGNPTPWVVFFSFSSLSAIQLPDDDTDREEKQSEYSDILFALSSLR